MTDFDRCEDCPYDLCDQAKRCQHPRIWGHVDGSYLDSALRELRFYVNRQPSQYEKGPSITQREARAILEALRDVS